MGGVGSQHPVGQPAKAIQVLAFPKTDLLRLPLSLAIPKLRQEQVVVRRRIGGESFLKVKLDRPMHSADRSSGTSLERDMVLTSQATFVVDLPNGTYGVEVLLGDKKAAYDQMGVFLEGVQGPVKK